MQPFDYFWHVSNFLSPALGLAALLAFWVKLRSHGAPGFWRMWWILSGSGVLALVLGWWALERDGSMWTYAALIGVNAAWAHRWSQTGRKRVANGSL